MALRREGAARYPAHVAKWIKARSYEDRNRPFDPGRGYKAVFREDRTTGDGPVASRGQSRHYPLSDGLSPRAIRRLAAMFDSW